MFVHGACRRSCVICIAQTTGCNEVRVPSQTQTCNNAPLLATLPCVQAPLGWGSWEHCERILPIKEMYIKVTQRKLNQTKSFVQYEQARKALNRLDVGEFHAILAAPQSALFNFANPSWLNECFCNFGVGNEHKLKLKYT